MTISPSSMTTMTRTSSHRTNRPLRPQTCKGMPALCRHFYSAEGTRRNRAAKLGSPRSRNQKSSGCKCKCKGKCKGVALALAASHLLLQLIRMQAQTPRLRSQCRGYLFSQPRNRKSHFFKKKCLHPQIASDIVLTRFSKKPRGCGGIGRRVRFRSVWGQPHEGSSPFTRTT